VPVRAGTRLAAAAPELVFLDAEYTRLRLVKSAEEISWLRRGAQLCDGRPGEILSGTRQRRNRVQFGLVMPGAPLCVQMWSSVLVFG